MRFDPKLIHPDEPPLATDGEIELPGELSALADQLRDDAARLAERYPAQRDPAFAKAALEHASPLRHQTKETASSPDRSADSSYGRSAVAAGMAMSACAAVALVLALVFQTWPMLQPAAETALREASATPATKAEVPAIPAPNYLHVNSPATVSLADLSSPELEALLDLSSGQPGRTTSVSF